MIEEALQELHHNNQSLPQGGVPATPQVAPQVSPPSHSIVKSNGV